ncbi:MAG: hypothetical protein M3317_15965, partial [Actinomycetota bacterium]|nr:hypothetical protein [Actinomycetota bacterium]
MEEMNKPGDNGAHRGDNKTHGNMTDAATTGRNEGQIGSGSAQSVAIIVRDGAEAALDATVRLAEHSVDQFERAFG